ncbi:MAG: lamin tail domain-containing protein [Planctomycetales bacterium]|nr:lamin tail domain-containing protein [Planctomycetales bacterium]
MTNRANYVLGEISGQLNVFENLPDQNGYPRTTDGSFVLTANAPLAQTRSVQVNGLETNLVGSTYQFIQGDAGFESQTLLSSGTIWRYKDDGSNQGTAWRSPTFNDQSWASGPSQLGYGDGDEATRVSNGGGVTDAQTTYFRTTFDIDDPTKVSGMTINMVYDDGAAVYINGVEAVRVNLDANAAFDDYSQDTRSNSQENNFVAFTPSTAALNSLVAGDNVIAVEIHQSDPASSDISFDMELVAQVQAETNGNADDHLLSPGLNRLTVQAFDQADGQGNVVAAETLDVWFDDGSVTSVSSDITANTVWKAADGPFVVNGDVTVAANASLTIEPGTSVFFNPGARLTINGRIVAIGEANKLIRFAAVPSSNGAAWGGLQFRSSMVDNQIQYAILEHGVTSDGMIGLENSRLTLDHVTLDKTDRRRIRSIDSSLVVRNSTFTTIFEPGQAPTSDNQSEHIWGRGIPAGGEWILENNYFGHITGHNDSVDFDAPSLPNPIPIIRNNEFAGGGDDALDMTGDVFIEGNRFHNFIKDQFNTDPGESNTISASTGTFWVYGNVFDNVQHASLVKETAFMYFINNTVASSSHSPLYFDLPGQTSGPGRGALVEGSIFNVSVPTFDYVLPSTDLTVRYSYLPTMDQSDVVGVGNLFGDPHVGGASEDFQLRTGSLAHQAGANRRDMGATSGVGVALSGVPAGTTSSRSATLTVSGTGYSQYRYRLNGGTLSTARNITTPITLSNLANGLQEVEVIGLHEATGIWQSEAMANSYSWTVNAANGPTIRINEVLASNKNTLDVLGETPDAIELVNYGTSPLNLEGWRLTDDLNDRDKFVFSSQVVQPGRLVVVFGRNDSGLGMIADFQLNEKGDSVYLIQPNGTIADSVTFGLQIPDLSIGRFGPDATWQLNQPTLGQANRAQPVGDGSQLVINEWYASGDVRVAQDFIELHNADVYPVDLSGYALSDAPFEVPDMSPIASLSFIAGDGYQTFIADGDPEDGHDHVAFRLSPVQEKLGLIAPDGSLQDFVMSFPQTSEVSYGRQPDAAAGYGFLPFPTPGASNGREADLNSFGFGFADNWRYEASGTDLGTSWRTLSYDDSNWPSGPGLLGQELEQLPETLRTSFALNGSLTFYFRKSINLTDEVNFDSLSTQISTIVDDGFVVYVNGQEVVRQGMPNGNITFTTTADRNINEAGLEGPFEVPSSLWQLGKNVIAVEVHQQSSQSGDMVFGLALDGSWTTEQEAAELDLLDSLRIVEVMYNPAGDSNLEFIEVQNVGDVALPLKGVRLGSGVEFTFPNIRLGAGQRAVIANNVDAFLQHYGPNRNLIGQYSGDLSDGGEELSLLMPAPYETAILRFDYADNWQPTTDGAGRSLQVVDATVPFTSWANSSTWTASPTDGGSPGTDNGVTPSNARIVINEVLTHTDLPLMDAIELHNPTNASINIGGWYLSDSAGSPNKFQIPANTIVPAGGYVVFDESDFNVSGGVDAQDFALSSSTGERIWLWSNSTLGARQVVDSVAFGAAKNGESFGRYPNATGSLYPMLQRTLGAANSGPRVGPVVISEIHYHPADPSPLALAIDPTITDDDLEFIEIHNPTGQTVDLTQWRIRQGVDFDFPDGATLGAGQTLLVVSFNPAAPNNATKLLAFRSHYDLLPSVRILGGYAGKLDNGGESIQLQRPDEPPAENPFLIPRLLEDQVTYDDANGWPTAADGDGASLQRIAVNAFGSAASSWRAADPTPGRISGGSVPGDVNGDGVVNAADIDRLCLAIRNAERSFDLTGDGQINLADQQYLVSSILGTTPGDANLDGIFNSADFVAVFTAGQYEDSQPRNSGWAQGDWNCDGDFTTADLVYAFQSGSYSNAAEPDPLATEGVDLRLAAAVLASEVATDRAWKPLTTVDGPANSPATLADLVFAGTKRWLA